MSTVIKRSLFALFILHPLIILVILKSLNPTGFRTNAENYGMAAVERTNVVTADNLSSLGKILIVNLDESAINYNSENARFIRISPDSILNRSKLRYLRKQQVPLVLHSSDAGTMAAVWMVLSQTGLKDIYILSQANNDEEFKHEFRPDTMTRPEF